MPEKKSKKGKYDKPITLHPIAFDEAVSDMLKVKPESEAKSEKKRKPEKE